ncbi:MAG: DDE-type integrase/transposase/recombinase [Anaerolineae bacterium]|nr:DDE-type integrase/transposase/recombinase [Anaerolineae bacterium]
MLDATQLLQLCQRLDLSAQAQSVIDQIRSSPPSRRVRSVRGNVSVRYPSQKMGVIIQAESHTNELAFIYKMEYDPRILEYYDQPPPIKLTYSSKSGRTTAFWHTPDFFVIGLEAVTWVECKVETELIHLAEEMPHRYIRDHDGRWRCPPGERYAQQFQLSYQVWSSAEIDWIFQRNIRFLADYLRDNTPPVRAVAQAEIFDLIMAEPGLKLDSLLHRLKQANSDDVYTLIATGQLFVDLNLEPLAEPERVRIFRDQATAQAYIFLPRTLASDERGGPLWVEFTVGSHVNWDGQRWLVLNGGETNTTLSAENGTIIELPHPALEKLVQEGKVTGLVEPEQATLSEAAREILAKASPEAMQEANRRYYQAINPSSCEATVLALPPSARTLRRWRQKYRQAQERYGYGYLGLLPNHHQKGNRARKLPESTHKLMTDFIENNYETFKQKNLRTVYGQLVDACQANDLIAPSYKTFAEAVKQRPRYEQLRKRQGRRAAEPHRPFYWELSLTTPRHGDRPFEIVHVDHTELDIELLHAQTGTNLGRPWASFMVDAFSRRLLAIYLTYDPPSYRSCMMVLRECVRRHGRLPQTLVVDGGKEFHSTYFETLLARYEIIKKTRPAAQPRFGAVCERLFGTANTIFIHNLVGNTQIMTNVRQVTKAVNPKNLAGWTLGRLYSRLCQWAYEVYDLIEHPALGQSPGDAFVAGLRQSGYRLQRLIPYNDDFIMATLPTTPKGTAKVQPNLGVKIKTIYYWSDHFRNPEIEQTQVPIRYDPFNAGLAYAFVKPQTESEGQWVECLSQYYAIFAHRSERELKLASAELRRQHQRHGQRFTVSAKTLASFLTSLEAEEVLAAQRLRDTENQTTLITFQEAFQLPSVDLPLGSADGDLDLTNLEIYGDF